MPESGWLHPKSGPQFPEARWRKESFGADAFGSNQINRTFHAQARLLHDVNVNLCGREVSMPQQSLHRANVVTILQQMRCERVPQCVAGRRFG